MSLSGLPPDILAHIFTLSDIDYQGNLDRNQFGVAMHLIQRQIQGKSLPKGYSDDLIRMYNQLVQSRGGSVTHPSTPWQQAVFTVVVLRVQGTHRPVHTPFLEISC